jgi:hypothetical protein
MKPRYSDEVERFLEPFGSVIMFIDLSISPSPNVARQGGPGLLVSKLASEWVKSWTCQSSTATFSQISCLGTVAVFASRGARSSRVET